MRFFPFRFLCLLLFVCCVFWIKSDFSNEGSQAPDLEVVYKRLREAEELGTQVNRDLGSILEQLINMSRSANNSHTSGNVTANNTVYTEILKNLKSSRSILQPNIFLYLPHLAQKPDSLVPNVALGQQRRGVSIVLGIPTVKREKQSYLESTLSSLLFDLTPAQRQDILIIIFVAETDSDYVESVAETISKSFPNEVASGLVEVVSPSRHYYPDFDNLSETFGDSIERVKWRTKQNLDFSFLMLYAQDKGTFYVQLEDDIVAKSGYYSDMKTFALQQASKPWLYLEFSQLGFIGKMFRTRDLPMIAEFFLMFHTDKPIDWLLDHILWVKVCNPEKDAKDCDKQKALLKIRHKPSLFQHVGLHSSLRGKVQQLKDKDFGKQTLFHAHSNPPAQLTSSLKHYQQHSLDRLYHGQDFLWALTPVAGDYILFNFSKPITISGFLFRSGNIETSRDQFYNTTVEVLPSSVTAKIVAAAGSSSNHRESDQYFVKVGAFKNGVAEGKVEDSLQPVSAIRLFVHSDSDVWALLSEVHIQV